ncbi:MAG: hypothetical protein ACFFB2_10060 [Promethearchaeota archaeon]
MTDDLPIGVLIKIKRTNERCGQCNEPFTMETYLDPLSERRSYRVQCKTCNYTVPLVDD